MCVYTNLCMRVMFSCRLNVQPFADFTCRHQYLHICIVSLNFNPLQLLNPIPVTAGSSNLFVILSCVYELLVNFKVSHFMKLA